VASDRLGDKSFYKIQLTTVNVVDDNCYKEQEKWKHCQNRRECQEMLP
jgi:hypothetical protein